MERVRLDSLKKGDYFTLVPTGSPRESQVYVKDSYDRSDRKYVAYKFSDISYSRLFPGDKLVYSDFIF